MINGILVGTSIPETEKYPLEVIVCFASFTTVYAIVLSFFLFYPIYLLNVNDAKSARDNTV